MKVGSGFFWEGVRIRLKNFGSSAAMFTLFICQGSWSVLRRELVAEPRLRVHDLYQQHLHLTGPIRAFPVLFCHQPPAATLQPGSQVLHDQGHHLPVFLAGVHPRCLREARPYWCHQVCHVSTINIFWEVFCVWEGV